MSRLILPCLILFMAASPATAQKWVNIATPWSLVEHSSVVDMIDDTTDKFVYGTERGFLYIMERDRATGRLKNLKQREVWAPVHELKVAECDGDHQNDLVVTTRNGDLFVIRLSNLEDIWRTQEGRFQFISTFSVADVDGDKQPEIVMIADNKLVIMAGSEDTEKYRSSEDLEARQLAIADVDNDGQDEIVLDTGKVFDARFRQLEWDFEASFGNPFDILDIDGDGNLEIVGTIPGKGLQVVEPDTRRVKWE